MGQFSVKISAPTGSILSGIQQILLLHEQSVSSLEN